jgi:hypothetical protein
MPVGHKFARWAVKHMPMFVILQPERVFIGIIGILLGVGFYVRPGGINSSSMSMWLLAEISMSFFFGGIIKLVGLKLSTGQRVRKSIVKEQQARALERLGASLIGLGAISYGLGALILYGRNALILIIIMLTMGGTNIVRLLISTAGRSYLEHAGKILEGAEDESE